MIQSIKKRLLLAVAIPALLVAHSAQAHIVGITWNLLPSGDVKFDALHWHGDYSASNLTIGSATASLFVNGTQFDFTSVTNNVASMPGIGGLDNSLYSNWDGSNLTVLTSVNDWLHVTVPASAFLPTGQTNTLSSSSGPGQLSEWTLTGGIQTINIVLPPPSNGVPDSGATLALLGVALLGLGAAKRKMLRS